MMRRLLAFLFGCGLAWGIASAQDYLVAPAGDWQSQAPAHLPRPPVFARDGENLTITLENAESVGFWDRSFDVAPGRGCRIAAVAATPEAPGNDVMLLATWSTADPKAPPVRCDYVDFSDPRAGERIFTQTFAVPPDCVKLDLRGVFKWRSGTTVFRNITVREAPLPLPRRVRIAAVQLCMPWRDAVFADNLRRFEKLLQEIGENPAPVDLAVFPECISDQGVSGGLPQTAERIPGGPTFELVSRYAAKFRMYVVANVHEQTPEGIFYNTAFIVDRAGKLAGKYRKVHLSMKEMESGLMPGREFPVFDLDFGKVGILICWDNWFPESARQLRLAGAELLLYPIAADGQEVHWRHIWPARAIDNGIPQVVAVRCAGPSGILDRDGNYLASTWWNDTFAVAEVDLNDRKGIRGLSVGAAAGDPTQLYLRERRPETYSVKDDRPGVAVTR